MSRLEEALAEIASIEASWEACTAQDPDWARYWSPRLAELRSEVEYLRSLEESP